MITEENNRFLY